MEMQNDIFENKILCSFSEKKSSLNMQQKKVLDGINLKFK